MHLYPIDGAVRRVAQGRDGLGRPRRDLVDGHRRRSTRTRSRPEALKTLGPRLLGRRAPVQPRRRLRQLHDGRRRRGARPGELRRQLRAARRGEEEIRPGQPVPGQPEHQAGGITAIAGRLGPGRNPKVATRWHPIAFASGSLLGGKRTRLTPSGRGRVARSAQRGPRCAIHSTLASSVI